MIGVEGVDGDEEGNEVFVEFMEEVSCVPARTEYKGRAFVCESACGFWWGRCESDGLDHGPESLVVLARVRFDFHVKVRLGRFFRAQIEEG